MTDLENQLIKYFENASLCKKDSDSRKIKISSQLSSLTQYHNVNYSTQDKFKIKQSRFSPCLDHINIYEAFKGVQCIKLSRCEPDQAEIVNTQKL